MTTTSEPQTKHEQPQSPQTRRLAAIDVGTNSIRLIIAEASSDGGYRVLDDEKVTSRLGQGLATTGRMSKEGMERSAQALERMKAIADGYSVDIMRVIGTAVLREAENTEDFLDLVKQRTGMEVIVISAEEEARLAHLTVSHAFDLEPLAAAVVDIGGGSMEVVLSSGGVIERVFTLPLGAVRLTEMFGGGDACSRERYTEMRSHITGLLEHEIDELPFTPQLLIGAGGTMTTLAAMSLSRYRRGVEGALSPAAIREHEMLRSELKHLLDWLRQMPIEQRAGVAGLPPERADIIVAGLTAAERLMKHLGVNTLRVHDRGIRDGLLLTMVEELFPKDTRTVRDDSDRMSAVLKFAATCAYDRRHCDHVAKLALRIYDQLTDALGDSAQDWAGPQTRTLLEAAGVLHDIGYHINYTRHHHHSYHLIVHADMGRFTPREIEVIANVARYHRKAEPKKKHPNFSKLKPADQRLVRALSGILRVADGLDRAHMQNVRDVGLTIDGAEARFEIRSPRDPGVDIWGATRKQQLFEDAFSLAPHFEWRESPDDAAESAPDTAPRGAIAPTEREAIQRAS